MQYSYTKKMLSMLRNTVSAVAFHTSTSHAIQFSALHTSKLLHHRPITPPSSSCRTPRLPYSLLNHHVYLALARPTALLPRSYTEYHFLRKASPRMARGPAGSGMSKPMKELMQLPCTSRM
jgi:hypothetical protein